MSWLGRRRWMHGVASAVAAACSMAFAPPPALPIRKARFQERGKSVHMRARFAELLRTDDRDAMASLSSGFATRLVYDLALFEWGQSLPVVGVRRTVRIHWDPWNRVYVVAITDTGRKPRVQTFEDRDSAIAAAVRIDVRLAQQTQLKRGKNHVYYVRVFAQRNPIEASGRRGAPGRADEPDLSVFSRWVGIFVRTTPEAERTVEVRTNYFYLEPPE